MSKYLPTDINLPSTYKKQEHPYIPFNRQCELCGLGERIQRHNKEQEEEQEEEQEKKQEKYSYKNGRKGNKEKPKFYSVSGVGPDNLENIKLIVLSDFPGYYESSEDNLFNMVDIHQNQNYHKKSLVVKRNAGSFLRMSLNLMFGLDTYTDCWITNAIKCNPLEETVKESSHLKICNRKWLANEFSILEEYCPTVPILVAGTLAFKSLSNIFPHSKQLLDSYGFNSSRRRSNLIINSHGIVVTHNPARIARSEPRIETSTSYSKGKLTVTSNDWLYPPLPGSPVDLFIKDLQFLSYWL